MKVKEVIDVKVRELVDTGVTPRYLILTAGALNKLCAEEHQDLGENAAAKLLQAEPTITYRDMEVVVAEISRLNPIEVSGTVRDELTLHSLKIAGMAPKKGT